MIYIEVQFRLEADDPDHSTGATEETYDRVSKAIEELGATDVIWTKVVEDRDS